MTWVFKKLGGVGWKERMSQQYTYSFLSLKFNNAVILTQVVVIVWAFHHGQITLCCSNSLNHQGKRLSCQLEAILESAWRHVDKRGGCLL